MNGVEAEKYYINNIARYKAKLLMKEGEKYKRLSSENKSYASILYKLKWLEGFEPLNPIDLDIPEGKWVAEKIAEFCADYLNCPMKENSEKFHAFSKKFQNIYRRVSPNDTSLNSGCNRNEWKHTAINNHFKSIAEKWSEVPLYSLEKSENLWILKEN